MKKIIYVMLGLLFLLNVGASGAMAASTKLDPGVKPDSIWYNLNRLGEKINLTFTFSDTKKAQLLNTYAKERVAEVQYLMDKKNFAKAKEIMKDYKATNKQSEDLTQKILKDKKVNKNEVTHLKATAKDINKEIAPILKEINEEATVANQTDIKAETKDAIEQNQANNNDDKDLNNKNAQENNIQAENKDDKNQNDANIQEKNKDDKNQNNSNIQENNLINKDNKDNNDKQVKENKVTPETNNNN